MNRLEQSNNFSIWDWIPSKRTVTAVGVFSILAASVIGSAYVCTSLDTFSEAQYGLLDPDGDGLVANVSTNALQVLGNISFTGFGLAVANAHLFNQAQNLQPIEENPMGNETNISTITSKSIEWAAPEKYPPFVILDEFGFTEIERKHILMFLNNHANDFTELSSQAQSKWIELGIGMSKVVYEHKDTQDFFLNHSETKKFYKENQNQYPPQFVVKRIPKEKNRSFWYSEGVVESDLEREFRHAKMIKEELESGEYRLIEIPKYMYLKSEYGKMLIASKAWGNTHVTPNSPGLWESIEELVKLEKKTGLCDIRFASKQNGAQCHNCLFSDFYPKKALKTGLILLDFDCINRIDFQTKEVPDWVIKTTD